jgi:hypothetical protein
VLCFDKHNPQHEFSANVINVAGEVRFHEYLRPDGRLRLLRSCRRL